MGPELDKGQYVIYTLSGLLVIGLMAWAMNVWWSRRRPRDGGGAAGFIFKILDGYEPTPSRGSRQVSQPLPPTSRRWRCALSDDSASVRALLEAPPVRLDRWTLLSGGAVITLSDTQAAVLRQAMCVSAREAKRTQGILEDGAAHNVINVTAQSSLRYDSRVSLSGRQADLNGAGVSFAIALVGAGDVALRNAADYLARGSLPGVDWMPADEFEARGGVLREY